MFQQTKKKKKAVNSLICIKEKQEYEKGKLLDIYEYSVRCLKSHEVTREKNLTSCIDEGILDELDMRSGSVSRRNNYRVWK